jgi:hypothetical protein
LEQYSQSHGPGHGVAEGYPSAGAIRAAKLVGWDLDQPGWDLDQPGRLTDGSGEIQLNKRSPASLQTTYRRQWEEHAVQGWLRSKLLQTPASPERDTLLAEGVDLQPLTKVLRASGKAALRPAEKRKVLHFLPAPLSTILDDTSCASIVGAKIAWSTGFTSAK